MCLTDNERDDIRHYVHTNWGEVALDDPMGVVQSLETYSRTFAQHHNDPGRTQALTPGHVLIFAQGELPEPEPFLVLTERVICDAVRWIGYRVAHHEGNALREWSGEEIASLRTPLWQTLVSGNCWCHGVCHNLRLTHQIAQGRCQSEHHLACWDGLMPLRSFVFRALVSGMLRLAGESQAEVALVNGFRHGMLAKIVASGELRAGYVLRHGGNCSGEIMHDDHCMNCGELAKVEDASWWLWLEGQRRQAACYRCLPGHGGCNCLYFRNQGICHCEALAWHTQPVNVWVPATWVSLDQPLPDTCIDPPEPPDHGLSPPDELSDQEDRAEALGWLAKVTDATHRAIFQGLIDRCSLQSIAATLGQVPTGYSFRRLCNAANQLIPNWLRPQFFPPVIEEEQAEEEEVQL